MPRSKEELHRAVAIQSRHLMRSCAAYDAGDAWEALRIATIMYTLLQDAGKNRSLFGQLGIKHRMTFMSTAMKSGADVRGQADKYSPLVEFENYREDRRKNPALKLIPHFVPTSTFLARRGGQPFFRELPFEDWWESDIIFFDPQGALTRKKLTLALRNQEGGSHYDEEVLNPNYLALRKPFWMVTPGYGFGEMSGLELATMRQMAEELRISVRIWNWQHNIRKRAA